MIRVVATASLLALLILVPYLPAVYPPQRFIQQIRVEAGLNASVWGEKRALRILARMLDMQTTTAHASPVPAMADAPIVAGVDPAVASEMQQVNRRLFNNPYFRSIDALLALAAYRLSSLVEWLAILVVFMLAVLFDGLLLRIVKSKEFVLHNPELYALHACAAIMTACVTVVALVIPITLHPLMLPIVPVAISFFLSRATAHFHRRD
jgi:hypothetical protein